MQQTFYDVTTLITSDTTTFPDDPSFSSKNVSLLENGEPFHLCKIELSNHLGTHIDFPRHVMQEGKTSSDYSLQDLMGEGQIIEVPENISSINADFVRQQKISPDDIVFFKTANSKIPKNGQFRSDYVYLESDAAKILIEQKVRIVGIDYLSVDHYQAQTLPIHRLLLGNNVLIVENLDLSRVAPGRCTVHICPLNIKDMDGLPVRAMIYK